MIFYYTALKHPGRAGWFKKVFWRYPFWTSPAGNW